MMIVMIREGLNPFSKPTVIKGSRPPMWLAASIERNLAADVWSRIAHKMNRTTSTPNSTIPIRNGQNFIMDFICKFTLCVRPVSTPNP